MIYIYCIYSNTEGVTRCYIGQTKNFNARKTNHKSRCNNENNSKHDCEIYKYIRTNGGWDAFKMEVLEIIEDGFEEIAGQRELYWIQKKHADLNKQMPTRTKKQYREQKKEQISEQKKQYYEQNKEQIIKQKKQKIKCECGCMVAKRCLKYHLETKKHTARMILINVPKLIDKIE